MDFKRKLKIRLYVGIALVILGALMIVVANIFDVDAMVTSFGLAFAVVGIVRMRYYFIITKNEDSIIKQEIAETDERNVSIINRARSVSFLIYIMLSGVAIIVLSLLGMNEPMQWISYSVCALIAIYWISYFIIKRAS